MKEKKYSIVEIRILSFEEEDIVTTSLSDGVDIPWNDAWNIGEWNED